MRVRINLSVSEAEYSQVEALTRAGGYPNACAFVRDLLIQAIRYAARNAQDIRGQPTPIEEEISQMFADLMNWDTAETDQLRAAVYANEKPR